MVGARVSETLLSRRRRRRTRRTILQERFLGFFFLRSKKNNRAVLLLGFFCVSEEEQEEQHLKKGAFQKNPKRRTALLLAFQDTGVFQSRRTLLGATKRCVSEPLFFTYNFLFSWNSTTRMVRSRTSRN